MLVALAQSKFYACEVCLPNGELTFIETLLSLDRVTAAELSRIYKHLECPSCESPVSPLDRVVPRSDGTLSNERRFARWLAQYSGEYDGFERVLTEVPKLAARHPCGRKVVNALRRAEVVVPWQLKWYRVVEGGFSLRLREIL